MKKVISILSLAMLFTLSVPVMANTCYEGGPGSTSCTNSGTISQGWWIFSYEISWENSVSCGEGYYACCNSETASCIPSDADQG